MVNDALLIEQVRQQSRNSLYYFVRAFWPQIEPVKFIEQEYIRGICKHLEDIFNVGKLLVNKPPRHGVSQVVSVLFPAWLLCKDPTYKFLIASYALGVSSGYTERTRRILESPIYRQCFPEVVLTKSSEGLIETSRNGSVKAVSIDSGTLSEGANLIIFDDPNNSKQINSQAHCKDVIDYWEGTLSTRLNPARAGAKIVVQQRLGFTDLSQHLLDTDNSWHHLNLPFEAGETTYQSKWWCDDRKTGEYLSTLLNHRELEDRKKNVWRWATQFNQRPRSKEGSVFTRLNYYTCKGDVYQLCELEIPLSELTIFGSSDLAISERSTADYTVIQVWGAWKNKFILLYQFRGRITGTKMLDMFTTVYHQWNLKFLGVEDVAFQRLAIQQLRERGLTIKAFKPEGDKVSRSLPAQIKNESNELWFPELVELEDELLAFPNGRHDDMVDSVSMGVQLGIKYARYREPKPPLTEEQLKARNKKWEEEQFNKLMMEGT